MKIRRIEIILCIEILILVIIALLSPTKFSDKNKEKHSCTNFVVYREKYNITPLVWSYRTSFKCVECGKDYKK